MWIDLGKIIQHPENRVQSFIKGMIGLIIALSWEAKL
jgi:hypothetical protein